MKKLYLILILACAISCGGVDCKSIKSEFHSYPQAIELIEEADFEFEDSFDADSSWIRSFSYFSCDGEMGYLTMTTLRGREYIHDNVPIYLWQNLKQASSSGSFYNNNLKYKYALQITR